MSKKSKKELAKAEALMAKALKIQAKAQKMKDEAALMQLSAIHANTAQGLPQEIAAALNIQPAADPDPVRSGQSPESAAGMAPPAVPDPDSRSGILAHLKRHRMVYAAITALLVLAGIFWAYSASRKNRGAATTAEMASQEKPEVKSALMAAAPSSAQAPTTIAVLDKWEMPDELLEISSNAFIDADRVACIQDAEAIIYTYNLKTRKVEGRLKFGKPGDFEALSVVGNIFYALRSDGLLFEVRPAPAGAPSVTEYDLPLKAENETEPMFYDQKNKRLLVGVKEKDPQSNEYKGVYSFDLATKKMSLTPVMTIPTEHEAPADAKKKKPVPIKPSEIALDPRTGDLYVLNGPHAEFLIVDQQGNLKQTIQLDKSIFPQPEGMCFSPSGELYISSEGGKKGVGVLAKVELR